MKKKYLEVELITQLKELYRRNDPEAVIRLFENQPSLHRNASAVPEYVEALVEVDRLEQSELLKTLQRSLGQIFGLVIHLLSTQTPRDGTLGTAGAPVRVVALRTNSGAPFIQLP
ncbi:hypothetical protein MLD38_014689 [Melastoma candidum]|uniref:Uncharacterized protein n=1 Tax=Melastoma candidum TaxID=119954 RepID=A0ACB9RDK3_9MYRT|nr:hypothetical protein MLD38_014689 [Melastoma candidum]